MSEWPMVKLGDLGEFINGFAFKPSDWSEDGTPIIRIQNLTNPQAPFNRTTKRVKDVLYVEPGDLLVSWSATLGVFRWQGKERAVLNQHIFKVVSKPIIENEFLEFSLKFALQQVEKYLHGATMRHVNRQEFLDLKIPLPPLGEQKRIAEILGGVSKAIQILEHELQLLGEISVLEQQNNLSTQKLSDLVTIRSGTVDPTLSVNRNLPHIAPDSIEKNTGRILQIRSCEEDKVTSGKYHFYKGDVLYSKIRPYLNKVVIAPFEGLCSADMYALRPKEGINSEVLQALLMSKDFLAYAEQWSGRASIPKINRKALLAYNVPKMTDKQVNEVKAKIQSIHKVVELKCRKLSLLQELQKSLANRAFAGLL